MCFSPLPTPPPPCPQYIFFIFFKRIFPECVTVIKDILITFAINPFVKISPFTPPAPLSFLLYSAGPPRRLASVNCIKQPSGPWVSSWAGLMGIPGRRSEVGRGIYSPSSFSSGSLEPQPKVAAPDRWFLLTELSKGFSPLRSKGGNRSLPVTQPGVRYYRSWFPYTLP